LNVSVASALVNNPRPETDSSPAIDFCGHTTLTAQIAPYGKIKPAIMPHFGGFIHERGRVIANAADAFDARGWYPSARPFDPERSRTAKSASKACLMGAPVRIRAGTYTAFRSSKGGPWEEVTPGNALPAGKSSPGNRRLSRAQSLPVSLPPHRPKCPWQIRITFSPSLPFRATHGA
jgi:hypothetical protein